MSSLVERLAQLRRHLAHLAELQPRVRSEADLEGDLSLQNDVLFSLLTVCQLVIDLASELSSRRGLAFQDYTEAVRNLAQIEGFDDPALRDLELLPGFRNVVVHAYVRLDLARVVEALDRLEPVRRFADAVARLETEEASRAGARQLGESRSQG